MSTDLVRQGPASLDPEEIKLLFRVADALAKSGMFKDTRSGPADLQATKAFAKMIVGRDLGLNTTQSMMGIHVLPNGIQVHYAMLLWFVRAQPGHDYRIVERTDERSTIEWILDGEVVDTTTYTMEEARLAKKADTEMYRQIPQTMLLARNVSRGVKEVFPEALAGIPLYVDDELPASPGELSDGEGTGESSIKLPAEAEFVIRRAAEVRHARLAERSVWEYWFQSPAVDMKEKVREAVAELDAYAARRDHAQATMAAEVIQDADVVDPDLPVDDVDLPEPSGLTDEEVVDLAQQMDSAYSDPTFLAELSGEATSENLGGDDAEPADGEPLPLAPSAKSPPGEVAAQDPFNADEAVRRLRVLKAVNPTTPEKEELVEAEEDFLKGELHEKAGMEWAQIEALVAGEDPSQESLL